MDQLPEINTGKEEVEVICKLTECSHQISQALKVLQNEDRLLILCALLREGELTVSSLGLQAKINQPSLSQQLTILRKNKMVGTRRSGKNIYYCIENQKIRNLMLSLRSVFVEDEEESVNEPRRDTLETN